MRVLAALASALALAGAEEARAQASSTVATPAPAIRTFDLRTLERLGEIIWRQDVAAAKATDALLKQVPDPGAAGVRGWVASPDGSRIRFVRDGANGPEAAWDVDVPARGDPRISAPGDRTLSAEERARLAAVRTAAGAVRRVCRPRYNQAVAPDPDGEGWLVWLLAPSPAAGAVPLGGHYRATVSADGRTLERMDALSNGCLVVDPRQGLPAGAQPVGVMGSHLVSPTPVETHVFLQRAYGLPVFVAAGGKTWRVDRGRIAEAR